MMQMKNAVKSNEGIKTPTKKGYVLSIYIHVLSTYIYIYIQYIIYIYR